MSTRYTSFAPKYLAAEPAHISRMHKFDQHCVRILCKGSIGIVKDSSDIVVVVLTEKQKVGRQNSGIMIDFMS